MSLPTHLQYTREHEWIEQRDDVVRIGITPHAADALGDIVYVQLPDVGQRIEAGESCGELESTKSVSDLYAPVTGEVTAVNESVVDDPSLVNAKPFEDGWLVEVRAAATGDVLTAQQYAEFTSE